MQAGRDSGEGGMGGREGKKGFLPNHFTCDL